MGSPNMTEASEHEDILILNGVDEKFAGPIIRYFSDRLITVKKIEDLPSRGVSRKATLDHYLKSFSITLILVHFDINQQKPDSYCNISEELARCERLKGQYAVVVESYNGSKALYKHTSKTIHPEYVIDCTNKKNLEEILELVISDLKISHQKSVAKILKTGKSKTFSRIDINHSPVKDVILKGWDMWDKRIWELYQAIPSKKYAVLRHCAELIDLFIWENYKVIFALYSGVELTEDNVEEISRRRGGNITFKTKHKLSLSEADKICSQGLIKIQTAMLNLIRNVLNAACPAFVLVPAAFPPLFFCRHFHGVTVYGNA